MPIKNKLPYPQKRATKNEIKKNLVDRSKI